jgi:inner membrane protein
MDSMTHAALGAAVSQATLGRQLGRRAAIWGAAIGILPDLDIIAFPWMDTLTRLEWHRGPSHSLPFILAVSPLLGWLISRIHRGETTITRASIAVFLVLATHVLIDAFNVYGTSVLAPLSGFRGGLNNLFIIDPLFTACILAGLAVLLIAKSGVRLRRYANLAGLALAALYATWSFSAKTAADSVFEKSLGKREIPVIRFMSSPTAFNTILWRCLAETPDSFLIGYHSLLAPKRPVDFLVIPKNSDAARLLPHRRTLERLLWFSNGYLTIEPTHGGFLASDWRFAELQASAGSKPAALFAWRIGDDGIVTPLRAKLDVFARLQDIIDAML